MTPFSARSHDDVLITAHDLQTRVTELFAVLGCPAPDAEAIAGHLVRANSLGHDSHGVSLIPLYVRMVEENKVDPVSKVHERKVAPGMLAIDAGRSFGQVAAKVAMDRAIDMVADTGLALVVLRDSHHVGRIGHWAEQCADAGYASLHVVNVVHAPPVVAPFGGREARLHTNPIAIGVPRDNEPALILDFATSRVAQGKMRVAMARGVDVPDGYLIDACGEPTNDPAAAYGTDTVPAGSLLPFGTYKGFGLGLMCDVLAGAVGGGRSLHAGTISDDVYVNNMLSVVFDMNRLSDPQVRNHEMSAVIDYVTSCAASDEGPVRMPGAGGRARQHDRMSNGIPVDRETWAALEEIFQRYAC